jgi:hypothetical protein
MWGRRGCISFVIQRVWMQFLSVVLHVFKSFPTINLPIVGRRLWFKSSGSVISPPSSQNWQAGGRPWSQRTKPDTGLILCFYLCLRHSDCPWEGRVPNHLSTLSYCVCSPLVCLGFSIAKLIFHIVVKNYLKGHILRWWKICFSSNFCPLNLASIIGSCLQQ